MKFCNRCQTNKALTCFNIRRYKSGKIYKQPWCKQCQKDHNSLYCKTNKKRLEKIAIKRVIKQALNRNIIREAKNKPCFDCHKKFPFYVMDFHHLDALDKKYNVSHMTLSPIDKLNDEISKCVVLCANCHRIREHGRSNP